MAGIKNKSSKDSPAKTLGNIQEVLAEHGAQKIQMEYENRKPVALSFSMWVGGQELFFRLTVDVDGMLQAMKDDPNTQGTYCNREQAERTAWKNRLDWLQTTLAQIKSNQARMEELLLGFAITDDGQTVYERLKSGNKLLTE
ncbi:hypothetical protein [Fodinibius sp.]|uniref:hypothetical protein n=1 Tax=Fodinibius sp. TaxID=1872440 RepID=UPI002ACDAE15|nr:hypothetical protein [Fodinibius sp.]MDZ7658059.1 hypothetical protein [Fodinibius sp.]